MKRILVAFSLSLPRDLQPLAAVQAIRETVRSCFFASLTRDPEVRVSGDAEDGRRYEVVVYAIAGEFLPEIETSVRRRFARDAPVAAGRRRSRSITPGPSSAPSAGTL
jgi:hypothetical protein